tara:strand:+ start:84 stop:374 length:291 start_codon:yes stop_codon:yes gene_type:complete
MADVIDRDTLLKNIRVVRDEKLALSDIDMLRAIEDASSWSAFNTAKADWVTYRTALRDYPSTVPDEYEDDLSDVPAIPMAPNEDSVSTTTPSSIED